MVVHIDGVCVDGGVGVGEKRGLPLGKPQGKTSGGPRGDLAPPLGGLGLGLWCGEGVPKWGWGVPT